MSESLREQIIFNPFSGPSISNRTRSSRDDKASPRPPVHLHNLGSFSLTAPGLHRILVIFQICRAVSKPMPFVRSVWNVHLALRAKGQMASPL